jgi:hypothetical protein
MGERCNATIKGDGQKSQEKKKKSSADRKREKKNEPRTERRCIGRPACKI